MSDEVKDEKASDGVERRSFLKCMAWAGTGLVWAMNAGVLTSCSLLPGAKQKGVFSFVQISDSHIGFNKEPNQNVTKTFQEAVDRINALEEQPAFLIHTGDITQLSTPDQFDRCSRARRRARCITFPASMTCSRMTEKSISSDMARELRARGGKASIIKECTLSA
jgi:Icc protein